MVWQVLLDPGALRELDALDGSVRFRIWRFLYERLAQLKDPRSIGQALRGTELGDLWKYRVGDYRIFARILDDAVEIIVVELGHRSRIYRR
jgi:mRNA interferase RelE/StbE